MELHGVGKPQKHFVQFSWDSQETYLLLSILTLHFVVKTVSVMLCYTSYHTLRIPAIATWWLFTNLKQGYCWYLKRVPHQSTHVVCLDVNIFTAYKYMYVYIRIYWLLQELVPQQCLLLLWVFSTSYYATCWTVAVLTSSSINMGCSIPWLRPFLLRNPCTKNKIDIVFPCIIGLA